MATNYRVYNSHGKKYAVPRVRVLSISELGRGDHIAFHRMAGLYWHHAIVEYIDEICNEINVIHYSNTATGFIKDNCSSPKRPGIARVVRDRYYFDEVDVYLMKHKRCLDPETVVWNAISKIGRGNYNPFTNNCEHFAMWCKTGKSSSDQVDKAGEMIVSNGASKAGQAVAVRGVREGANKAFTQTASRAGQRVVQRGVHVATNKALTGTASKAAGQGFVKSGVRVATNQALTGTASRVAGQGFVKSGVRVATNQALTGTASRVAGQGFVKSGVRVATNQALAGTASRVAGQGFVKSGVRVATSQALTGTAPRVAGQVFVKSGVRVATNQALTRSACASQTSTAVGIGGLESLAGGAVIGATIEGISMMYDINCASEDMAAGRISHREFENVVGKRIITGTTNVGGTVAGMAIGQALIPVPIVGGLIGAVAGGILGSLFGNTLVN